MHNLRYPTTQGPAGPQLFHTYPSSDTARSLAVGMLHELQEILRSVPSDTDVPPWVLMLMSQAAESVHHVQVYTSYYGQQSPRK